MTSIIQELDQRTFKKSVPELKAGFTVRVHQKIREGDKERVQIFEGLVIKVNAGYGMGKTFTVRKVVDGVGVEKIFPVHAPAVVKIDVMRKAKVRRAKLYYMRKAGGHKLYQKEEKGEATKAAA